MKGTQIMFYPRKAPAQTIIISGLWLCALLGLLYAQISRFHLGLPADWASMSFYFVIPAALWTCLLPLVRWLTRTLNLNSLGSWAAHLFASILLSVALRLVALTVDFYLQSSIGWMHDSLYNFLYQTRYLLISSSLTNFIIYWSIVFVLQFFARQKGHDVSSSLAPKFLILKTDPGLIKVSFESITHIEAFGNYLKVHTVDDCYCTRGVLRSMALKLDCPYFHRIHRSFIINEKFVHAVHRGTNRNYLFTVNGCEVSSGRQYKVATKQLMSRFQCGVDH